jgi:hypothetical protein
MANDQEDYIIRIIAMIGQMLARITALRQMGNYGEALQITMIAQEKLFGHPAAEFVMLPIADQLALLARGEPAPLARAKGQAYAALIKEAAQVYQARGDAALAASALELSLMVILTLASDPGSAPGEFKDEIADLSASIRIEDLHPPVRALLDHVAAG